MKFVCSGMIKRFAFIGRASMCYIAVCDEDKFPSTWTSWVFFSEWIMVEFGKINEFNPDAEDWAQDKERLDQYFVATDIDVEEVGKQWTVLLRVCASQT